MYEIRSGAAAGERMPFHPLPRGWAADHRERDGDPSVDPRARASAPGLGTWGGLRTDVLAVAIEGLPIAAALTDPTGGVLLANRAFHDLLGPIGGASPRGLRLPLPDGEWPVAAGLNEVQAGRVRLASWNGAVLERLVVVVGVAAAGRLYLIVDEAPGRRADADPQGDPASRLASLTLRERQVLRHLLAAGSNKAVARELGISPRTIEVHRSRALHKLGVKSLTQAYALVVAAEGNVEGRTPDARRSPAARFGGYDLHFR